MATLEYGALFVVVEDGPGGELGWTGVNRVERGRGCESWTSGKQEAACRRMEYWVVVEAARFGEQRGVW